MGQFIQQIHKEYEILVPLTLIFNHSLETGEVPNSMKVSKLIPLFKSKDKSELGNYRPISILPSLSKILEKLIYKRLCNFMTNESLLHHSQYGFRRKHSTINAITEFYIQTVDSLDHNHSVISVFMDLSKAFDTIDHNILLHKLEYYSIIGTSLNGSKAT